MKAYVMEAYFPAGGTYMAYHLGRILQEDFGYEAVAVGTPPGEASMFDYSVAMPSVSVESMLESATSRDLLVCNPSFSDAMYGLRLPCRKISYVQNVRTFRVLDVFFDHYVFVSDWVRRFVAAYYGIDGPVIPAFIHRDIFRAQTPWRDKRTTIALSERKHSSLVFRRLQEAYKCLFPADTLEFDLIPVISQKELAARMGSSRYFLSLDVMEGFGLPMLEAMSCGCVVVGWDSGGCREYARSGSNCLLARYGDFEVLARHLHAVLHHDDMAGDLSERARQDAGGFGQSSFDRAWSDWLSSTLPAAVPAH